MKIAVCKSRTSKHWENVEMSWEDFVARLEKPIIRNVTRAEFLSMPKEKQMALKDVGGFIGGALRGNIRKRGEISERSIITLDLDHITDNSVDEITLWGHIFNGALDLGCGPVYYPTFKSTKERPRYRVLVVLTRPVSEEEYPAVARKLAEKFEVLDYIDESCFNAHQLMFWPAFPKDAEDRKVRSPMGRWALDPDKILALYKNWQDVNEWPRVPEETELKDTRKKAGDPLEKPYPIGLFCRTYDIEDAINTFLPGVYEQVSEKRWHYAKADASAGAVVYEGKWLYSNHTSDPAGHILCNAFDLVRIHKFAERDAKVRAGTPIEKLPSYKAMCELVDHDTACQTLRNREAFGDLAEKAKNDKNKAIERKAAEAGIPEKDAWRLHLEIDKAGRVKNTLSNMAMIVRCDEKLKNIWYSTFSRSIEVEGSLPWEREKDPTWRESDYACLNQYISDHYGQGSAQNIAMALLAVTTSKRSRHPIKEYLKELKWDGVKRCETLFIDYLGAEDNELNRAFSRKWLTATVARVLNPGCKFDQILTLVGPQGIGKSRIGAVLGGKYYTDSLTVSDMSSKVAVEKIMRAWIAEISELSGFRKTENEITKSFISRQVDVCRQAYARTTEEIPRHCTFIGTTNEEGGFLRDLTGNRRYWIMHVPGKVPPSEWNINVDQVWAEAVDLYRNQKEKLWLDERLATMALEIQTKSLECDEREGFVQNYLDRKLPENWGSMDATSRAMFLADDKQNICTCVRQEVSIPEIWCECFGKNRVDLNRTESNRIAAILQKLGWKRYDGSTSHTKKRSFYGAQVVYMAPKVISEKLITH